MPRLFTYGDAPVDEVELSSRSQPVVERLQGSVPTTDDLAQIAREQGLDLATMVFYQAVLASPTHAAFTRLVDGQSVAPRPRTGPTLLIVPAMFYKERPDLGGDGSLVASIARTCGFRVAVVGTNSRGWISENAAIVWNAIQAQGNGPVWLMSLSKGGGEVRLALQQHSGADAWRSVRGWINVCGIVRGSHFVDDILATAPRRLRARAFCLALGTSFGGAHELRTTHPYWQVPFDPCRRMTVINLVGVPLGCHVQKGLVGRYRRLGALGPNDGFMLLPNTLIRPGPIYPLWGVDHLFRSPQVSPLLYRLFNLLLDREESSSIAPALEPELARLP
jgi:hypothetical protein